MTTPSEEYLQDGPEAQQIASVIPYYPFHGVPRFYDISGMTHNPEIFQLAIDVFVRRYTGMEFDAIAGLDARGFVMGPPIALALKKPFIMIRKKGKLPNAITGAEYHKEYVGDNAAGGDELCLSRTAVTHEGMRILVIDDLVATGGTLIAAVDLLTAAKATVVECACMVELKMLNGAGKLKEKHPSAKVWALISEDILQLEGTEGK
jgi:adenine phosphoribosyltransferase